ncbi:MULTISPECIES: glycoside hydrolase family 73 protein [Olivibacter]|uniref:Glycoside hydrolase family 73 protein n=1 Tax=Olivibacter jilunii TaxID=985016 RepID=A0ABW6AZA7_9SPHI
MTRQEYIKLIAPVAQKVCNGTGLFASLLIAQAIVESHNGAKNTLSLLASKYHNHFGIKSSKGWTGAVVNLRTREVFSNKDVYIKDGFRAYPSLEAGFADRNRFLTVNQRYTRAGLFSAKTPEQQAIALQVAGYATDPNYAKVLGQVINGSGNLKQYDV